MENQEINRTEINDLGEFKLIELLTQDFDLKKSSSVLGIGDDAAVIQPPQGNMVMTTDLLVEGIHFDMTYTPLKYLGYKAVVVNLSDIYAMNAIATQITVSIAVSNRYSVEALAELYEGIREACEVYKVDRVRAHVGDQADRPLAEVDAFVEPLGDAHGAVARRLPARAPGDHAARLRLQRVARAADPADRGLRLPRDPDHHQRQPSRHLRHP